MNSPAFLIPFFHPVWLKIGSILKRNEVPSNWRIPVSILLTRSDPEVFSTTFFFWSRKRYLYVQWKQCSDLWDSRTSPRDGSFFSVHLTTFCHAKAWCTPPEVNIEPENDLGSTLIFQGGRVFLQLLLQMDKHGQSVPPFDPRTS